MSDFANAGIAFVIGMAIFGFIAIFFLIIVVSGQRESNQMREYDEQSELLHSGFVSALNQKVDNFQRATKKDFQQLLFQ